VKIFSVVGIRRSGKTTTITELIQELKRRGYRVGTAKTIFCPTFSIDDGKSNTSRHLKAGADIVCAKAREEVSFIYPHGLDQNEIVLRMKEEHLDYLILEGDYEADVPRIVCAHKMQEVVERANEKTFVISGRIADKEIAVCGIQAISAIANLTKLADKVIDAVREAEFPIRILDTPFANNGICQCGCHKACTDLEVHIHTSGRKHIFLTGEKQIGKSTILSSIIEMYRDEIVGFQTMPFLIGRVKKGYYMHNFKKMENVPNDMPISIRIGEKNTVPVTESFDKVGTLILKTARGQNGIMIMDELGKMEREAYTFQREVFQCLDTEQIVVGVLQKTSQKFIQSIKNRTDVIVYEVTKENRDSVKNVILDRIENERNKYCANKVEKIED